MAYLVTGATGFIGKHLVERLLLRPGAIYALVREESKGHFQTLVAERWGGSASRIHAIGGDITKPGCAVSAGDMDLLTREVRHVFHLAAIYDLDVSAEDARVANVEGTRHVVALANAIGGRATFNFASSVAVAGKFKGFFREDMFDEGQKHEDHYARTKFESEALVRQHCNIPFRIYRPGIVIGSSETGEAEKIDGPYVAFKAIQKIRGALPQWMPLLGFEGGTMPIVPVDYVAKAMDELAHTEGLNGRAFHLIDPKPPSVGKATNIFCRAAHAPEFTARVDHRILNIVPAGVLGMVGTMGPVKAIKKEALAALSLPESVFKYANWRTKFDTRDAEAVLKPKGITCPPLEAYAWKIWDYWERHLDPDLRKDRTLAGALNGKNVVITGASSGIGRAVALKVAEAGGHPILVSRSRDKLEVVRADIEAIGKTASVHPCDLSVLSDCDDLVQAILERHGHVDYLVNNAGRSIRRSVGYSYDRFHDFERTMKLNYFGSLKLVLGFLPSMRARRSGHIINVSSVGVQTNTPRFSAYVASKAALDAFSRCIASEVIDDGIHITTVYMPLVRTPMIAPTKIYDAFPAISPDEAAMMILESAVSKPKHVATKLGTFSEVAYALAPKVVDRVLNLGYHMFPESVKKDGESKAADTNVSAEGMAFAYLLQGVHW